ncbi:ATP-binding protein [Shewanella algidipiscicola]|uniref:ATP-binding protein n=1 Tax=Shewanella algidipiscicola TaxID=614070 RepID=UPI000D788AB0|nr:ATP-binding protein [Shewanella algidipiscicola]
MKHNIITLSNLWAKLNTSLLMLCLVVVFVVSLAIIFTFEFQLKNRVIDDLQLTLGDISTRVDKQVQDHLSKHLNDLRFLHATPPVEGLSRAESHQGVDPLDGTTYKQWRERLETIFMAFLRNNIEYDQLRIIGTDGIELVRVDKRDGVVQVVSDINLQNKRNRDYYQASMQLIDGEIYTSPISLNREFDKIEYPYRPMLRMAIPIHDDFGQRFGFLVANVNANQLLHSIEAMTPPPNQLILIDSGGYFLLHPDNEMRFSRDLDQDKTWGNRYDVGANVARNFSMVTDKLDANEVYYALTRPIIISNDPLDGLLQLILLTPKTHADKMSMGRRISVYTYMLALGALFVFVVVMLNRSAKNNQNLAKARAQSAAIINGSKDAIIGFSNEGKITNWNRAAQSLFGYDYLYVMDRQLDELPQLSAIELPKLVAQLNDTNKLISHETQLQKADDTQVELSISVSVILGEHNEISGVAIVIKDITIEKLAAQKILQANAELEEKVAVRTAELEQASHVKSGFISNISHEMRTPLNGIVGTLNLVRKEPLSDKQRRYLDMAEVSVNALSVLINDVLDLSKIEAGKLDLDFKSFNPLNLVESICSSMAVKAQEKGLEFIIDVVDLRVQSIISDPHRVSQILTNLINNAVKFTDSGFIKVTLKTELLADETLTLTCAVTDTGMGVSEEYKDKLFNAFSQETTSIAAQYGGTGLGLSICQQLSELLNGSMSFESTKGLGSTFSLTMCLARHDYKLMANKTKLEGAACAILVTHPEQHLCIERSLLCLDGRIVSAQPLVEWLCTSRASLPTNLPKFIVIEQQHELLFELDARWTALSAQCNHLPKILVFQQSSDIVSGRSLNNIEAAYLNNPLLMSELQQRMVGSSIDLTKSALTTHVTSSLQLMSSDINCVKDARVLIVDDNDINIEVAIGILSSLPIHFVQASNGDEAIQRLLDSGDQPIHSILMDCQMPILNGYDCTKRIRQGEAGEAYINVPIVAMTASAMMGEREKCIDAGMNDYVTKPIAAERLIEAVLSAILSSYQATAISAGEHESVALGWDKAIAIARLMDNNALFCDICTMYCQTTPKQLADLASAIKCSQFEVARQLSHSLKGLSSSIGASELQMQFHSLEMAAQTQDRSKMVLQLGQIEPRYRQLLIAIQDYLAANDISSEDVLSTTSARA